MMISIKNGRQPGRRKNGRRPKKMKWKAALKKRKTSKKNVCQPKNGRQP